MKLYNELPKDYKLYKTPLKLMPTETMCCPANLRIDLYQGCSFSCLYCYAMDWFLHTYHNWWRPAKPCDFNIIKKAFDLAFNKNSQSKISKVLRHRQYIRLGSCTDVFQPIELKHKLTLQLFKLLNKYDKYPALIFTKSILQAKPEYIELMQKGNYVCQESISIYDDKLRKKIEPGTFSTPERLKALETLHKNNIPVQVRISPHMYPICDMDDTIKIIQGAYEAGCNEIIWEPIRLTKSENKLFISEAGIDLIKEMEKYGEVECDYGGGCYRNIFPIRQDIMKQVKKEVTDRGMKFYHCLAEDGFNTTCPGEDCCGMDNYPEFSKGALKRFMQPMYVMLKEKGILTLKDVEHLYSCDEKTFKEQWNKGYFARYMRNIVIDDYKDDYGNVKYKWSPDSYGGKKARFRKGNIGEWI